MHKIFESLNIQNYLGGHVGLIHIMEDSIWNADYECKYKKDYFFRKESVIQTNNILEKLF